MVIKERYKEAALGQEQSTLSFAVWAPHLLIYEMALAVQNIIIITGSDILRAW